MTDVNDKFSEQVDYLIKSGVDPDIAYHTVYTHFAREHPFDVIKRELKKLDGINDVICRNVPDRILAFEVLIDGCDFDEQEVFKIIAVNKPFGTECVGDHYGSADVGGGWIVHAAFSYIKKTKLSFECLFSADDFEMLIRDGVTVGAQLDHIINSAIKAAFPDAYGIQTSISRMDED
jgi:hypothetical protein